MDLFNINTEKKKRKKSDLNSIVYGKIPPHATDIEMAVLGQMLIQKSAINEVVEYLKPESFYKEAHQFIFEAMLSLRSKSRPIDSLLLTEELRFKERLEIIGGQYYLTKITDTVVSSANIKHHCRIIVQKYIQRKIISLCGESITDAYEDSSDVFELLDSLTNQLRDINNEIQENKNVDVAGVSLEVIKSIHTKAYNARDGIYDPNEIFTQFPEWDKVNGSLFPGLFVIAGRPGMGKGVVMTELICRMGKYYDVGVVNGEMTDKQLLIRIGCNLKQIDNLLWKKNPVEITDDELKIVFEAMQEAQKLKLHIEDSTYLHRVCAKIRMWVDRYGVKIVMIDFLTLIRVPEEIGKYWTEVQKINYIMETLRGLCKELNIPIIIFAQLNRDLFKRGGNKEPNLSDLKGSGNIEEFAFQISFLHRPEYYDITVDEYGEATKGLIYFIIAKHRDGELKRMKYKFSPWFSKIDSWDFQEVPGWKPTAGVSF